MTVHHPPDTDVATMLVTVAEHITVHELAETFPSVHTRTHDVELRPPWAESRLSAVIRWARSLGYSEVLVHDTAYGYYAATIGLFAGAFVVVCVYTSPEETFALRETAPEGALELDELATYIRTTGDAA